METFPTIGVLYMATALRNYGLNISVMDSQATAETLNKIIDFIKEKTPKIICISVYSDFIRGAVQLADAIKASFVHRPVLIGGGPHISNDPLFSTRNDFDYYISGEADLSLPAMVVGLLNKKSFPKISCSSEIDNLDILPMPDRSLCDLGRYYSGSSKKVMNVHTSRGCPYKCVFCSKVGSPRFRSHSVDRVIREVDYLKDKFGVTVISFTDDNFLYDRGRALSIFSRISGIKYGILSRCEYIDDEVASALKDSGCETITFGVESANDALRNGTIKKSLRREDIYKSKKLCDKYGIKAHYFFMSGFPNETPEDLKKNERMGRELETVFFANWQATCYPGTEIFKLAVANGKYPPDYWNMVASGESNKLPLYWPDGYGRNEYVKLVKRSIYRYYTHPKYLIIALKFALLSRKNFGAMFIYAMEFGKHLFRRFILRRRGINT